MSFVTGGMSRSRTLSSAIVLPLLCVLLVLLPASPSHATSSGSYTVTTLHFKVDIGPNTLGSPRTCDVIGDLYVPKSASPSRPVPALMTTNGFAASKDQRAGSAGYAASQGYVVLAYSGLGSGGSGCKITFDDPDTDGRAASQLVSYLGGAPGIAFTDARHRQASTPLRVVMRDNRDHTGRKSRHDPRVGMFGSSYGGALQFAAAAVDARIDTIVPMTTWNDLSYSLAPNNTGQYEGVSTTTPGATKVDFGLLLASAGMTSGLAHVLDDPRRILPCPNFPAYACPMLVTAATTGYLRSPDIARLRHASVSSYVDRVRIPTLLMQGEGDTLFNLNEAIATYRALRRQGTPVKMIWTAWGHTRPVPPPGEYDSEAPNRHKQDNIRRMFNWFDHYLKGQKDVSTGPGFTWFRDWVDYDGIATPAYGKSASFPVGSTRRFYLSGRQLVTSSAAIKPSAQTLLSGVAGLPTSVSGSSALGAYLSSPGPDVDLPGTFAQYTTPTLARKLDVVGSPKLTLRVKAPATNASRVLGPAGDLVLFVRIHDVGPNGASETIEKLVAPVRVADARRPFTVTLPAIVHRFKSGHSVRITVAGSSTFYRGGLLPSPVTIATGSPDQVLTLPVTTR